MVGSDLEQREVLQGFPVKATRQKSKRKQKMRTKELGWSRVIGKEGKVWS